MKTKPFIPSLLFFSLLVLTPSSWAAEETITVVVTGFGATPEAAEKSALQKAVRKAVGEIVDAETITNNEEVIKDKVLSYSDGFVQSIETINGPTKDPDLGLFLVTIEAKVLPKKVAEKLKEAEISTSAVAGEDIWAQAVSKISNVFEGREMLAKLVNEEIIPARLLKARLISEGPDGKPLYGDAATVKQKIDYDAKTVEMTYMIEVSWDREAYLKSIVPKMTALLEKLAVAPPVEVRGPLFKTGTVIYPNGEHCYAAKSNYERYIGLHLERLNQSVRVDTKKGPGQDGKYDCAFPGSHGEKFRTVWSKDHFFALLDVSTKEEEFVVKVFTLKGDEYYKVFFQNISVRGWEWDSGVGKMAKSNKSPYSRPTQFPDLAMELVDNLGNIFGSRLLQGRTNRLVSKVKLSHKSSLLAQLNPQEKIIQELRPAYCGSYGADGGWRPEHFSHLRYLTKNDGRSTYMLIGNKRLHTGFFDRVNIRSTTTGRFAGFAHLTMPKFFYDDFKGMSNSTVFRVSMTLPYETTKNITSVKLHWLDDSWINSNLERGSLKPKDIYPSYDFDSMTSGRTGLSFEYVENDLVVTEVTKDSPSAKTGKIKPGDHILGSANPVDLMEQNLDGPLHWQPFGKLDKKNAKETLESYRYGRGRFFWKHNNLSDITDALENKTAPLVIIPELFLSGPPDTYVYLLIKPASAPTERVIVPVLRKLPSDFEKESK